MTWRLRDVLDSRERDDLCSASGPQLVTTVRIDDLRSELQALLNDRGIEHVLLKGPALSELWKRQFGGLDLRTYGDLDILVREVDAVAVDEIMTTAGLRPDALTEGQRTYRHPD